MKRATSVFAVTSRVLAGATGSVIVHQKLPNDAGITAPMLPGVVVHYAWPRRPDEPVGGYPRPDSAP
jgi:hypothetical protein